MDLIKARSIVTELEEAYQESYTRVVVKQLRFNKINEEFSQCEMRYRQEVNKQQNIQGAMELLREKYTGSEYDMVIKSLQTQHELSPVEELKQQCAKLGQEYDEFQKEWESDRSVTTVHEALQNARRDVDVMLEKLSREKGEEVFRNELN